MKYQSDADVVTSNNLWIIEIFKNLRLREDKPNNFYKNDWVEFHPKKWGSGIQLEKAGYFDERPQLDFYLTNLLFFVFLPLSLVSAWFLIPTFLSLFIGVGKTYLNLPFKTGIQECESPSWGFYVYAHEGWDSACLVIETGKDLGYYIYMPWNLEWYRTSYAIELVENDPRWVHEFKGQKQDFWDKEKWGDLLWTKTYPYTYKLKSGKVQNVEATVRVEEREWRRRWLMWTSMFNKVRRSIDIDFSDEVGERAGSWKGGVLGCGYELKPNETPLECLRRMERERKFN